MPQTLGLHLLAVITPSPSTLVLAPFQTNPQPLGQVCPGHASLKKEARVLPTLSRPPPP